MVPLLASFCEILARGGVAGEQIGATVAETVSDLRENSWIPTTVGPHPVFSVFSELFQS